MAAITNLLNPLPTPGELRPFDVRRDLSRVADLVEQCFSDTLDPDGQHYLGQMRSAANNPAYLRWAGAAAEHVSLPLSGFVWEEGGVVVGNLTLIPFYTSGKRYYLIANVAVHPDYRRRGIARSLTTRAVEHIRSRGADAVWLHVREENFSAFNLYLSLGFVERARRSTWHSDRPEDWKSPLEPGTPVAVEAAPATAPLGNIQFTQRLPEHWPSQQAWLNEIYPKELTWHLSVKSSLLRPGIMGGISRLLSDSQIRQWSACWNGQLIGVLALQSTYAYADNLWLAASPENEEAAAGALLNFARQRTSLRRPLALDYPARRAVWAIQNAGFHLHQTLVWMSISLR